MVVVISSVNHNTLAKWKELCNFPNKWKNNFAGSVKVAIIVIRLQLLQRTSIVQHSQSEVKQHNSGIHNKHKCSTV